MNEDIVIRPERPDQPQVRSLLDALDRYLGQLYAPQHNHILDIEALLAPEVSFFAAWRGSELLGCAALRRIPGEVATGGRPYGEVKRMMVAPAARRLGIGSRLLHTLEDRLRAEGCAAALLETGANQFEAVGLYECAGYRRRGPFGGYPDNGLSLFFEKPLQP